MTPATRLRVDVVGPDGSEWDAAISNAPHDIFHTSGFHRYARGSGEGDPYLIVVERGAHGLAWPYLLRSVQDVPGLEGLDAFDVHSVYGYPGPVVWGDPADVGFLSDAWRQVVDIWRDQEVVSAFTRFNPILRNEAPIATTPWPLSPTDGAGGVVAGGPTISVDLAAGAETARGSYARDLRREIAASRRSRLVTRHDEDWSSLGIFTRLYHETMVRSSASQYYFFGEADFLRLRDELGGRLHLLVTSADDVVAAAGLFTELAGIVEWYLVGSSEAFRRLSPSKVLVDDAVGWAAERGNRVLHLGGGRGGREDTLLWFKGRFSDRRHPFHTGRWVLDKQRYTALADARRRRLAGQLVEETYFPVYRAPAAAPGIPPVRDDYVPAHMTWRHIGPADGDALAELLPLIDHTYFMPHPMTAEEARRIAVRKGRDVYLLAFDGEAPIGYGMLRGWDEGYEIPSLGIGIRRDYERRGLGRQLMTALHQVARERGATSVRLRVHPDNVGAAALYRSLGYRDAGIERAEILMVRTL